MKHISKLKDIGINKKCLIVGGGHSLNKFEWDRLNGMYIICLNDHFSQIANMIIYYDRNMKKYFTNHIISDDTTLIGFKKDTTIDYTCPRCDYHYNYTDMDFGDSGYHALQFVDKIFNFKYIYLIGYDYTTREKSYHHNENISDPDKMKKFKTWNIGEVLPKYKDMKWNNTIYNCDEHSKLEVFNYELPY